MKNLESKLQRSCMEWFGYQYPQYYMLMFAIPNGGKRGIVTASIMKAEGVKSGVADLMLAIPTPNPSHPYYLYHGLFIEIKYGKNKQSIQQVLFQKEVEAQGYKYALIYDFDSFVKLIKDYLK